MKGVLKWTVKVDDEEHFIGCGPVVHVACQFDSGSVQVWTEETENIPALRLARIYGTAHPIPDDREHVGSAVTAGGQLVWHVYAEPRNRDGLS